MAVQPGALRGAAGPVTVGFVNGDRPPKPYYASHGLRQSGRFDAKLVRVANRRVMTSAVMSGELDVGVGSIASSQRREKGIPFRIFAPGSVYTG